MVNTMNNENPGDVLQSMEGIQAGADLSQVLWESLATVRRACAGTRMTRVNQL